MENNEQKILQKHLQYVLCDVFNLPQEEDLLRIHTPTKWEYKGTELPEANVLELRAQASKLLQSELWKILKGAITHDAQQRALNLSKTESDIIGAKMEIYLLNQVETILKHMTQ
jgi:hypothetical protein